MNSYCSDIYTVQFLQSNKKQGIAGMDKMEESVMRLSGMEFPNFPKEYEPFSTDQLLQIRDSIDIRNITKNKKFNESMDLFNILKNDERCQRPMCLNSQEIFPSMMKATLKMEDRQNSGNNYEQKGATSTVFVLDYNDKDKNTILNKAKKTPLQIVQMDSEEEGSEEAHKLNLGSENLNIRNDNNTQIDRGQLPFVPPPYLANPPIFSYEGAPFVPTDMQMPSMLHRRPLQTQQQMLDPEDLEKLKQLLPPELQQYLQTLPKQYLKGYFDAQNQPQIKSDRRKRVERYLQKRKLKTWDKKICYNCRQKVAEERLRVKGRFVPRKKVLQIIKNQAENKS